MERQKFWDIRFAQLTKLISLWSKDPSTKVGAVIVRPDRTIVSTGYNGFPRGVPDLPEMYDDRSIKYKVVKHAEVNALHMASENLKDCTIYVYPLPPCSQCAGDIIQKGIKRVVAIVPPWSYARLTDPTFAFHLTEFMFAKAGVQLVILKDDVDLCALEEPADAK